MKISRLHDRLDTSAYWLRARCGNGDVRLVVSDPSSRWFRDFAVTVERDKDLRCVLLVGSALPDARPVTIEAFKAILSEIVSADGDIPVIVRSGGVDHDRLDVNAEEDGVDEGSEWVAIIQAYVTRR